MKIEWETLEKVKMSEKLLKKNNFFFFCNIKPFILNTPRKIRLKIFFCLFAQI